MHRTIAAISACLVTFASAVEQEHPAPWERHAFDVESGVMWQVGNLTPIDYTIAQTIFSWRSPAVFEWRLDGGSTWVIRNQASLIAAWIVDGPEDYYFGLSGAPSLEWWSEDQQWSVYLSVGGGVGVTNSTDVIGGQGQDFTLNWFAKAGVRYQVSKDFSVFGGPSFMHLSNGGQTDPNPGIDVLGFSLGVSYSF
jgi:lipid A 3-O-deacylase